MPFGTRNYQGLQNYGAFLDRVTAKKAAVDKAIVDFKIQQAERAGVQQVLGPYRAEMERMNEEYGAGPNEPLMTSPGTSGAGPGPTVGQGMPPAGGQLPPPGMTTGPGGRMVPGSNAPTPFSNQGGDEGSVSYRHNNPLNLKYWDFLGKFGATPGDQANPEAGDRGPMYWAQFPSPEAGLKAGDAQLRSPGYANLTVDEAMKKWSHNGYGGEVAPELMNKRMGELSGDEMNSLLNRMATREGWQAPGNTNANGKFFVQSNVGGAQSGPGMTVQAPGSMGQSGMTSAGARSRANREYNLTYRAFLDLVSQGTPTALKTAELLTKLKPTRDMAYNRRTIQQVVGADGYYYDVVEDPETGETFYRKSPVQAPEKKWGDTGEDTLDRQMKMEDYKNVNKHQTNYNNATATMTSLQQKYGGADKLEAAVQDAFQKEKQGDPDAVHMAEALRTADDDYAAMIMEGLDPKLRERLRDMREYVKAKALRASSEQNLRAYGKMINPEGKAENAPPNTGKGYSGGASRGYFGAGK